MSELDGMRTRIRVNIAGKKKEEREMGQVLEAEVVIERKRLSFSKSAADQERVGGVKSLTNRGRNKGSKGT